MPVGTTGTAQLSNMMRKFLADARYTLEHKCVMENLVRTETLPEHQGTSHNTPKLGTVTAYSLADGVDMAQAQQLSDSNLAISPAEVGAQVIITDLVADTMSENWLRAAGRILGNAMKKKKDQDLLGQIDSFTTTALGSGASTNLSPALISAAFGNITGGTEPAPPPYATVHHPYAWEDVSQAYAVTGTYPISVGPSADALKDYWVNRIAGTNCYSDGNFTIASDAVKGGTFSKEAIILVNFGGLKQEVERDASLRANEINVVMRYNWGEYVDAWGAELNCAASVPA